jgi:hypothetical protein
VHPGMGKETLLLPSVEEAHIPATGGCLVG